MADDAPPLAARFNPSRPAGSPGQVTFPAITDGRRFFSAELGFVPISHATAAFLECVTCDGAKTIDEGGKGPPLFQIVTVAEAAAIEAREREAAGRAARHQAPAGTWTAADMRNIGFEPRDGLEQHGAATAAPEASTSEPSATTPTTGAAPTTLAVGQGEKRVGRRAPKPKGGGPVPSSEPNQ